MAAPRILVVEDEVPLLDFYRQVLEAEGYAMRGVRAGEEALLAFRAFVPDLVILDLTLAGKMDGFEVLQAIRRENTAARVMILTGLPGDERLVRGLEGGADDYVLKQVSREHLVSRVRAHLRRMPVGIEQVYRYGPVTIDLGRNQITRAGRRLAFGGTERRLLARLLQTPGQPVTFHELLQIGWNITLPKNYFEEDVRILRSCIYRLRVKLGADLISSAYNLGFSIAEPDAAGG